ncbi:UDP-N-acetylglucosamine 2-epimerase (hydrolyzing) [bacterium]|nr:MAG: UDP-N-acetylglucosamine 2-epimerase (hydrolyzing) [bacterium]
MRTIGVVTVGRSDYGIYLPVLRRIQADAELRLHLIAAGMHLSPEFGLTAKAIEADGFQIGNKVEMLLSSDTPEAIAKSMGLGTIGFAQSYGGYRPDLLVVLGDRFEMHSAAVAALPFKIPTAHIHGGELTEGAIDDALRHCITKLSHLHFVSNEEYGRRLIQMGEEPWRVVVSGSPALDNLHSQPLLSRDELARRFGLALDRPPLLVTFHPITLEYEQTEWQIGELLKALRSMDLPVVFTMTNADTGGRVIVERIEQFVADRGSAWFVRNLGSHAYYSMMACGAAMVGNSSSGIVEAPSLGLPVVNVGARQMGRLRAKNVIDVGYGYEEIVNGIRKAIAPEFRAALRGLRNPYGDGNAAEIIVKHLKGSVLDQRLLVKRFVDVPTSSHREARARA